jgi:DNA-binding transcriptional MocR family regulator
METLYAEVADKVLGMIEKGALKEGDRVPSIRSLSGQLAVSVNTVKEAYLLLEAQRFLEARPQSGFYVRRKAPPLPTENASERAYLGMDPKEVSLCRIYGEISRTEKGSGACLSVAIPDPSLMPVKALERSFREALADENHDAINYAFSPGHEGLRREIARQSIEAGINASPEEVIITSGASEALTLTIMALCGRGDTVAVESPTYFNFLQLLESLGVKALEIPSNPTDGMNLEVLSWALDKYPVKAVICIPNFNNPLGGVMPDARKSELVGLLESRGIPLVEDDVYGELAYAAQRPRAAKSWDLSGNVILVSSFSKTLACGFRVGWALPGKYYRQLDKMKSLSSVGSATPTQMAISAYLAAGGYPRHLRRLRQALAEQAGLMAEEVALAFPEGTRVSRPKGGFVLWVELPEGFDSFELYKRVLPEGIAFSPGAVFSNSGKYSNCLRLNAGQWNGQVLRAVRRIGGLARNGAN